MWKLRSIFNLLLLCSAVTLVAAQGSTNTTTKWQTLKGDAPLVIARGGFSGLFPDSSFNAYSFAGLTSLTNVIVWCDVQLTKDGVGICFPDIKLDNASNVATLFKDKQSTYLVNGVSTKAWFPIDFNFKELALVNLQQGVYSRSSRFDGTVQPILTVEDVFNKVQPPPPGLWLNVQHDSFYSQHNLSMRAFVLSVSRRVVINYISSPEVNFLKSIASRINPKVTKLVFRFLGNDETEPSTNQTYGSLLQNLASIKTFASGILVPKSYILPVDTSSSYLQPATSLVRDAHKVGLEVYASDFANDVPSAFDYSYDPVAEYLSFIDNGNYSVDGVLSDFPITPSGAIDCYSHMGKGQKNQVPDLLVISFDGASGDYPGCTDKAYSKAVSDGVDIIDCTVQMTKDGIPFCMGSVNMIDGTTAAQKFSNLAVSIPELKTQNAIHSFDLNWNDIQNLQAQISNPFAKFRLFRNPAAKNEGKFMTLDDFLTFANATSVSGVLITIENAAYLAEKKGLGVTDAVLLALNKADLTTKKVMIHSNDSSVLMKFTNSKYERVYGIKEEISDIQNSTILEIKKFASSVIIGKSSVFPTEDLFLIGVTNVVAKLQAFKVKVYVQPFSNEFVSQAWDFFSDPYVEINSYVFGSGANTLDGVITGFPATANRYRRNRCIGYKETPPYMLPVGPGGLLQLMSTQYLPPAEAPYPVLTESDVVEPPLPPVAKIAPASNNTGSAPGPNSRPSGQSAITASISMISMCILLAVLVIS